MTSRERVALAFTHRSPDRVPINYMARKGLDLRLKAYYGLETERELIDRLGCDFYFLSSRDISQNETFMPIYRGPRLHYTQSERVCPFGIRFKREVRDDKFGADEAVEGPLEQASGPKDVLAHPWPKPQWFDVKALAGETEPYADKVIIGGFWSGIFGDSYRMHGFESFLYNMAMNPELVRTLVNRMTDFYLELNDRLFRALKGKLDVYFLGNDFGTQNGLLFGRDMWIDFFHEPYRRLVSLAKSYGLTVMAHSCGGIFDLLDLFSEVGIDVVDPVQTTAAGMDAGRLKEAYGNRLVFHGAVDTQHVLPSGTQEEVRRHVSDLIATLGESGGYVMVSSNNLQEDTPLENVDAMYEAARET